MAKKKTTPKSKVRQTPQPLQVGDYNINLPIVLFILTTFIFFIDHLMGGAFFWEDFTEFVYPVQTYAATESARGNLPFWNPYAFAGMPFLADLQAGFFYPFNRILTLFAGDGELPVYILQLMIILHFFFAQFGMYLLARSWKISAPGALISAVSYGFSFSLLFHVIHPMIVYHLAWFPLVIYFYGKALANRRIRCGIVAGAILGISMLAGHPQMTLYEGFFLGLMFLWMLIAELRSGELKGGKTGRFIIAGLIAFVIAAGIFSVQYLPSQQLADLSERKEMTYEESTEGSLQFGQIYTAIVPKLFGYQNAAGDQKVPFHLKKNENSVSPGSSPYEPYYYYWETAFYFGVGALLLGIFGALMLYRNRRVAFLIFIALFGFLFSLGANGFLYPLIHNLPLFGTFRNPSRMMFYFLIAFTLLAGFGFDRLWQADDNKKLILKFLGAIALPVLIGILAATGALQSMLGTPEQFMGQLTSFGVKSLAFMLVIAFVAIMIILGRLKPQVGGPLIFIIVFIDLFIAGADFNKSEVNPEDRYKLDPQLEKMLCSVVPEDIFRVNMRSYNPPYMAMQRNQGMIDRIMLIEGYNPLRLERIVPPLKPTDPETDKKRVHDVLNVRYEIEANRATGSVRFVDRDSYLPRAWMVHRGEVVPSENVKEYMENNYIDFSETAIVEEEFSPPLPDNPDSIYVDKVKCVEYRNNYMKFEVSSIDNGLLCFSEMWYPAWKAKLDNNPAKLLRTNYSLRSVAVPKGTHTVELYYDSEPFKAGMYISLFTVLTAVVVFIILERLARRRKKYEELVNE